MERAEPSHRPARAPFEQRLGKDDFSADTAALLRVRCRKGALVAPLLPKFRHPDLGEQIAEAFRNHFRKLVGRSLSADEVFLELMRFAGGARVSVPRHQVQCSQSCRTSLHAASCLRVVRNPNGNLVTPSPSLENKLTHWGRAPPVRLPSALSDLHAHSILSAGPSNNGRKPVRPDSARIRFKRGSEQDRVGLCSELGESCQAP